MAKPRGIRPTEGVEEPGPRDGDYIDYAYMRNFLPDEDDQEQRKKFQRQAWEGTYRESYEAQINLARRYRVRLVGFRRADGTYESGPFDRLRVAAQEEVLELCNRRPRW